MSPREGRQGYEFDYDELTLQVYELLCTFLASKALSQIPGPDRAFTTVVTTQSTDAFWRQ